MNAISNIWNHPRTSAAGVLIATVSIGSVLAQQGVTLGKLGNSSVIGIVTGVASALLGLFAQDPAAKEAASSR